MGLVIFVYEERLLLLLLSLDIITRKWSLWILFKETQEVMARAVILCLCVPSCMLEYRFARKTEQRAIQSIQLVL